MMLLIIGSLVLKSLSVEANDDPRTKNVPQEYFDLSYSFSKDTIFFPGTKEFVLSKDYDGVNKSGIWYSAYSFCMGEHGGTHLDAPKHFSVRGLSVDKIQPNNLIDVPAAVIDIEENIKKSPVPDQYLLNVSDLIRHEAMEGTIPFGSVLLVHTGWSKYWPDKIKYLGLKNSSSVNFPGVSEDAAKWLADERQIVGLGIDTPSVDVGYDTTYPVHVLFGERQIYNIENVANLHTLLRRTKTAVECRPHLFVLPIKIIGGTGSPARILAYCK